MSQVKRKEPAIFGVITNTLYLLEDTGSVRELDNESFNRLVTVLRIIFILWGLFVNLVNVVLVYLVLWFLYKLTGVSYEYIEEEEEIV